MREKVHLPNLNINLYQSDETIKINTDTFALGEFIEVYRDDVVLDIGTNTGALLLYASRFNPKYLIGIDINEKALDLASENLKLNGINNYELINIDARNYQNTPVDVVICNPPYFNTKPDNLSKDYYLNIAKHDFSLPLADLIKAIKRNLKDNGTFFILYKTSRLVEVIKEIEYNKLVIKELKFVYDDNKEFSNVVLIKGCRQGKNEIIVKKPLIITR